MTRDGTTAVAGPQGIVALVWGASQSKEIETIKWFWRRGSDLLTSHEALVAAYFYLAAVTLAELFTAVYNPRVGLVLHGIILLALLLHGARLADEPSRRLIWVLMVAPLIRIMSLSLPLNDFPIVAWYLIISIPLMATTALLSRSLGVSWRSIGLMVSWRNLPGDLAIVALGLPLGYMEWSILQPQPLVSLANWTQPLIAAIILTICTGFNEEFMFRGLMQTTAFPVLRRWSPLYVNLMFAVLHMGYQSALDLVFVFAVGMLFSWYTLRTGSIFGVTLCHGIVNITLFLIAPFFFGSTTPPTVVP